MTLIAYEFHDIIKAGAFCICMYGYPSCLLLSFNTLYGMLMLWLNVNIFILNKKINQLEWMNKGQAMEHSKDCNQNSLGSCRRKSAHFQEAWRLYT